MCFSAGASYSAAAMLGLGGIFILSQIKDKKQALFAAIPCIFAIQQLFEGFLWTSIGYNLSPVLQAIGMYGFLFFAIPFWPTWIPLSTYVMEPKKNARLGILIFLVLGIAMSILSILWIVFHGATSQVLSCHIQYKIPATYISGDFVLLFYVLATIAPLFISTIRYMKLFGLTILTSLFAAAFFYSGFFISVWCFFGALVSILIFMIIRQNKD
ncbi:hypothetical protein HOM50_03475 [bacterium]|jgi:hypothetical protein|nr:hypothetical protein [bacterium]MBT5015438.1 hypothetical protein [bacterium]